MLRLIKTLVVAVALVSANEVRAAIIGSWDASAQSWNHPDFSILHDTMISAGHSITADQQISVDTLANYTHFVIANPTRSASVPELSELKDWVQSGGIVITFTSAYPDPAGVDSGAVQSVNEILGSFSPNPAGVMSADGEPSLAPLAPTLGTVGPIYNIAGLDLNATPGGVAITGGIEVAGSYLQWVPWGSGAVFAFAQRSDHNDFSPTSSSVNGQLFLNIAAVPEPGSLTITSIGLIVLAGCIFLRLAAGRHAQQRSAHGALIRPQNQ